MCVESDDGIFLLDCYKENYKSLSFLNFIKYERESLSVNVESKFALFFMTQGRLSDQSHQFPKNEINPRPTFLFFADSFKYVTIHNKQNCKLH